MTTVQLKYQVGPLRAAGLEAKWSKTRGGAPIITVRDPNSKQDHQRSKWWVLDKVMWESMIRNGIKEGFDSCTILGKYFSITG